jgi:hypothetical protein
MAEWVFDYKLIWAGYKVVTAHDEYAVTFDAEDFESEEEAGLEWKERFEAVKADPDKQYEIVSDRMIRVLKKEDAEPEKKKRKK